MQTVSLYCNSLALNEEIIIYSYASYSFNIFYILCCSTFLFQHTTNCLRHNKTHLKKSCALLVSCNFVADFRWPHFFLWTPTSCSSSSGFPVSTIQQSLQHTATTIIVLAVWSVGSGQAENLGMIKPDGTTHTHAHTHTHTHTKCLSLSLLSDWKHSTFSPYVPLTMSLCTVVIQQWGENSPHRAAALKTKSLGSSLRYKLSHNGNAF